MRTRETVGWHGATRRSSFLSIWAKRRPQALQRDLRPSGPRRHSGLLVVKQERQKRLCGIVGRLRFPDDDVATTCRNAAAVPTSSGVAARSEGDKEGDREGDKEGEEGSDEEGEEGEEEEGERDGSRGDMPSVSSSASSDGEGEGEDGAEEGPRVSSAAAWQSRFIASRCVVPRAVCVAAAAGCLRGAVCADGARRRGALLRDGVAAAFGRGCCGMGGWDAGNEATMKADGRERDAIGALDEGSKRRLGAGREKRCVVSDSLQEMTYQFADQVDPSNTRRGQTQKHTKDKKTPRTRTHQGQTQEDIKHKKGSTTRTHQTQEHKHKNTSNTRRHQTQEGTKHKKTPRTRTHQTQEDTKHKKESMTRREGRIARRNSGHWCRRTRRKKGVWMWTENKGGSDGRETGLHVGLETTNVIELADEEGGALEILRDKRRAEGLDKDALASLEIGRQGTKMLKVVSRVFDLLLRAQNKRQELCVGQREASLHQTTLLVHQTQEVLRASIGLLQRVEGLVEQRRVIMRDRLLFLLERQHGDPQPGRSDQEKERERERPHLTFGVKLIRMELALQREVFR